MIRGVRPFVVPIIHMTCRAFGHHTQRARASASAAFAIEMWRAAMVLLVTDHTRLSVPLDIFLLPSGYTSLLWKVASEASPWRLAAGLYDSFTAGRLFYCLFRRIPWSFTVGTLDRRLQDPAKHHRIFLDVASLISDISFPSRFHSPRTSQECSTAPGTVCREWPIRLHPISSPKSSGVGWQWHPAIDETYLRDGYSTMDDIRTIRYRPLHAYDPPGVLPLPDR